MIALFAAAALSIYGPSARKEGVVVATGKTFKEEVIDHAGPVAVQFFAPWCGHCQNIAPAFREAARSGIAKAPIIT